MSPNPAVKGLAKFFPPEAWAVVVPVSFAVTLAGTMITRWVTQDPESRNADANFAAGDRRGADFKQQIRGFFRNRLNGDYTTRSIFNN